MSDRDLLVVKPVLVHPPAFWWPDYWSESAHAWDWVTPETRLEAKPVAEFELSLDITLGEVLEASCDAWGITPGSGMSRYGNNSRRNEFVRFAFVQEELEAEGIDKGVAYQWPSTLPIASEDGRVAKKDGLDITFRELKVSSKLGLLAGDITRPYVFPVVHQGTGGLITELVSISSESIRAAYAAVDHVGLSVSHTIRLIRATTPDVAHITNQVLDAAGKVTLLASAAKKLDKRRRKK